ncbi:MAG: hypothetical protein KA715_06715 [Xanthomonadaceae bacterium]|nr:hypothetical protein [Xanthomonadaceae bacterium]
MWNQDHLRLISSFSKEARQLRVYFDEQFKDPRQTHVRRFVWDYWNVPGEYNLIRTPAYEYFPDRLYKKFHSSLRDWGRETLGCHDVSPPWLSFYIDGCYQAQHQDQPHGPWAFVYSLTNWKQRRFTGGETMLYGDRKQLVTPQFNQLTVFNPAIPHGVAKVRGIRDPREARLAIHGWFLNPRPFIRGKLKTQSLENEILELGQWLKQSRVTAQGWSVQKFTVGTNGKVSGLKPLWTRLESSDQKFLSDLHSRMKKWDFGRQVGSSLVTLPLGFG